MKARQPKVEGNRSATFCQKGGIAVIGQEKPVRNRHIGETDRNRTKTVSRRVISVDQVKQKKIQSTM